MGDSLVGRTCILWSAAVCVAGCGQVDTPKPTPALDSGETTVTDVAACELAEFNALRLTCAGPPGSWVEARDRRWDVVDGLATVVLLPPETDVPWSLHDASGVLEEGVITTGPLPEGLELELTGSLPDAPILGMPVDCGLLNAAFVVLIDPAAPAVLWYGNVGIPAPVTTVTGITWRGPELWALVGRDTVRGLALDGTDLGTFERGVAFDDPVHHDLVWRDDRLYSLDATVHTLADGRYVLDGIVDVTSGDRTWALLDHTEPSDGRTTPTSYWSSLYGPSAIDWSHANTLVPDSDGWLVSFRHLDAVVRLAGDGTIDWVLGDPHGPLGHSFTWSSTLPEAALDLQGQHHATRLPDGRLMVFDNRALDPSRVVVVRLDGDQALLERELTLERNCPVQGGAVVLDSGDVLATCSSRGVLELFDPEGARTGRLELGCAATSAPARGLIRAIPVHGLP